jgi:hypothetical protein
MIQRIQSVYLLLVVILSTIVLFAPVAHINTPATVFELSYRGFTSTPAINALHTNVWGLIVVAALIPLIAVWTIFLYKKRRLQMRMCIINFVLMIVYYNVVVMYLFFAGKQLGTASEWSYTVFEAFPAICMVLTFMAVKAIQKDEKLIRSTNRLR